MGRTSALPYQIIREKTTHAWMNDKHLIMICDKNKYYDRNYISKFRVTDVEYCKMKYYEKYFLAQTKLFFYYLHNIHANIPLTHNDEDHRLKWL